MCAKIYCRVCCHVVLDVRAFYPFRVGRYRCLGGHMFREFGSGEVYRKCMFCGGFPLVGSSVLRGIRYSMFPPTGRTGVPYCKLRRRESLDGGIRWVDFRESRRNCRRARRGFFPGWVDSVE